MPCGPDGHAQFRGIEPYRRLCERRGAVPGEVRTWREIPAVPTDAFKVAELFLFESARIARTFTTSGTTRGAEKGKAHFDEEGLALMRACILVNARRFLFPDDLATRILILTPSPVLAPAMIMAHGMDILRETFGLPGSRFLVTEQGLDMQGLAAELGRAEDEGTPVTIIGASFGFVNLFDACRAKDLQWRLPEGSRSMDAGGYKGKSREVGAEALRADFEEVLGIPDGCSVNLLGMTELASQFYDNSLLCRVSGMPGPRCKVNPPWTRTVVVDPETLEEAEPGRTGLLRHFDLGNRERPLAIQTDDVGRAVGGGFEVFGRTSEDLSRGCSISVDELLKPHPAQPLSRPRF